MESPFNQIALRSPFFDAGVSVFTPLSLFAASEPGAWYDPSDMSTMFQDFNGATPVTAVEQPVSVLLDKSKNGVGTNGTRRLNLIIYTQEFDNAAWSKSNLTVTQNAGVAPDGTTTSDKLIPNTSNVSHFVVPALFVTPANSLTYIASVYLKADGYRYGAVSDGTTGGALFDLQTGSVVSQDSGITASTPVNAGNGWWRCSISFVASSARRIGIDVFNNSSKTSFAGDGTSGILAWGADLRLAADANVTPTYQRVTDTWYNVQAGSHAYTPSGATASRPVLSARYNLLTKTEQFNDAVWIKSVATVSANTTATTDPLGGNTADKLIETAASGLHTAYTTFSQISGTTYKASVYAKAAERNFLLLYTESNTGVWFDLSTGSVGTTQANAISPTITNVGNGWYQCSFNWVAVATSSTVAFNTVIASANNTTSYTGNGTSGIYIWGADLRVANDGVSIPTYQRVNTSTDYDTTNFPMYLRFDGSDDYMLTGTITPGTDKAQVFAGVRKLSDAAAGVVTEFSSALGTNNGSFLFSTFDFSGGAGPYFRWGSRGSAAVASDQNVIPSGYAAPITKVFSGIADIASDVATMRLDGSNIGTATGDQGTGNYLAYPLYIGRRGGATLPYNGRLYGAIIRFGANLDNTQITNTETWMNGKTKAY